MAGIRSLLVTSAIPLTIAVPTTLASAEPVSPADSDVVFCLAMAQRPQLADAAVALKMAGRGTRPGNVVVAIDRKATEVPVERWRDLRAADFDRACTALAGSARPVAVAAPSGTGDDVAATVAGLIPVAFGALLTGVAVVISSWWKDLTTIRRTLAADLTDAMRLLRTSMERFLASGVASTDQAPARAAMQEAWADAVGAVRRVTMTYPRQRQPAQLERLVTDADFRHDMNLGWHVSTEERIARADRLRASVDQMELLATRIASALQHRAGPLPLRLADLTPSDEAAANDRR